MGRVLAALAVVAAGSVTCGVAGSAPRQVPRQHPAQPTFTTRSDLVVLHVMVKDRRGAYLTGLRAEAFTVLEDGRPQQIRFFGAEDAPVTVGLIVDASGSMLPVRERVVAAAYAFAATSNPDDDIFALTFNERVAPVLPDAAPFTGDAQTLRAALSGRYLPRGLTSLHDAILAGLAYVTKGRHEAKVLVVVSDGGDNASRATFDETLRATQVANTVIYTIALADPLDRHVNPRRLNELAKATGGESFQPADTAAIEDVLRHIARDIRNTYTIGYVPSDSSSGPRFRRLRVLIDVPNRGSVRVRAREGYVLGEP